VTRNLIDYLWRLLGLLLTGSVRDEVLVVFYGPGGNGKGTFWETIVSILGDYAVCLDKGLR